MIVVSILLPMLVGLLLIGARNQLTGRIAAWLGALTMSVSVLLIVALWQGAGEVSGEVDWSWIAPLDARLHLGFTAISWPFALMTAVIGVACCLWLVTDTSSTALVGLVLIISAASLGVFSSLDMLLFFVFFELALIPMWFVIAWWGDPAADDGVGRRRAATRFLLFTVSGSALLLVGIVIIAVDADSLQIADAQSGSLVAAVLVTLGFAVKTPIVPLHTWLPDAHGKAPTVGSVLLAAVFLKLGTYGLIYFAPTLGRFDDVAPYLAIAGAIGIVWSALACYVQDDLKRMIAYSSIGHMGFVVIAISTQTAVGTAAAVVGSVAHGAITGLLFFVSGSLKDRFGTASMTAIGRGLYERTPWLALTLAVAAFASLGLPGLAGFWGEVLSLRAAYEVGDVLTRPVAITALVLALMGVALTTAYFLRALRLLAQGEPTPAEADRDLDRREVLILGAFVAVIVVLGLFPGLLLDLYDITGAVPR